MIHAYHRTIFWSIRFHKNLDSCLSSPNISILFNKYYTDNLYFLQWHYGVIFSISEIIIKEWSGKPNKLFSLILSCLRVKSVQSINMHDDSYTRFGSCTYPTDFYSDLENLDDRKYLTSVSRISRNFYSNSCKNKTMYGRPFMTFIFSTYWKMLRMYRNF